MENFSADEQDLEHKDTLEEDRLRLFSRLKLELSALCTRL